jgi:hypothetical protein
MPQGTFSYDFADWLDYTVTYYQWKSYDAHGAPVYEKSVTKSCYMEATPKLVRATTGQQVVSSARLYLVGNTIYNVKDKFVLPTSTSSPIISIDNFYNDKATLELSVINI